MHRTSTRKREELLLSGQPLKSPLEEAAVAAASSEQVLVVAAGSGDVEGGMEGSAQSERWNLNLTLLT